MRPVFRCGPAVVVLVLLPLLLLNLGLDDVEGGGVRANGRLVLLKELLEGSQSWESTSTSPPQPASPETTANETLKEFASSPEPKGRQTGGPPVGLRKLRGDGMEFSWGPSKISNMPSLPHVGALRRLSYFILNSSVADKLVSFFRYFAGPTPGRPEKALLRQADSVGVGIGIVLHVLRIQPPEAREAFSMLLKRQPEVEEFVKRYSELADPTRSARESLLQLLWIRRACARLALGAYDARHQGDFLSLVHVFRKEYMHLLGFIALVLNGLPRSFPALVIIVDRLLVPLQDALRSIASVSGRFPGFTVTLIQQQLLRWVQHLALLDATILKLVPGGVQALASLQTLSMDSSIEETDSRHGSQEEDSYPHTEMRDSHL